MAELTAALLLAFDSATEETDLTEFERVMPALELLLRSIVTSKRARGRGGGAMRCTYSRIILRWQECSRLMTDSDLLIERARESMTSDPYSSYASM